MSGKSAEPLSRRSKSGGVIPHDEPPHPQDHDHDHRPPRRSPPNLLAGFQMRDERKRNGGGTSASKNVGLGMREKHYAITGWALFLFSAIFFIAASWRSGDMLGFVGSLLFLLACFAFLVPLVGKS